MKAKAKRLNGVAKTIALRISALKSLTLQTYGRAAQRGVTYFAKARGSTKIKKTAARNSSMPDPSSFFSSSMSLIGF